MNFEKSDQVAPKEDAHQTETNANGIGEPQIARSSGFADIKLDEPVLTAKSSDATGKNHEASGQGRNTIHCQT